MMVENTELRGGLRVARLVMPLHAVEARVLILNPTDSDHSIVEGSELSKLSSIESVGDESPDSSSFQHSKLDELLSGLSNSISNSEKVDLKNLIEEFSDVFSKGDYDIGDTDIAQHQIDTGDSKPIKQSLRPQPYAVQDEIKVR